MKHESMFGLNPKKKTEDNEQKKESFNLFNTEEKTDEKKEKKESAESLAWKNFRLGFAKYITKPMTEGYGKLEYAKPLSSLKNRNAEIEKNRQASKMLSPEQGGPTREEIYASALKVAKQFGWQDIPPKAKDRVFYMGAENTNDAEEAINKETGIIEETKNEEPQEPIVPPDLDTGIPVFVTNRLRADLKSFGIADEQIDKLKPKEAWELLQQKALEKKLKEPKQEKVYSLNELEGDFHILQTMWNEAYERMDGINDDMRTSEILRITAETIDDPKPLEYYIKKEAQDLKPEEKHFIEMSIEVKKFRSKAKELLGVEKKLDSKILAEQIHLPREEWSEDFNTLVNEKIKQKNEMENSDEPLENGRERTFERYLTGLDLHEEKLKNKKIIDLGCGDGDFAKSLIEKNLTHNVYGVDLDLNENNIEPEFKNNFLKSDYEKGLPIKGVDYVVSLGSVTNGVWGGEKVMDLEKIFDNALASLNEQGEIRMYPFQESAMATPLPVMDQNKKMWEEFLEKFSKSRNVEYTIEPRNIGVTGNNNDVVLHSVLVMRKKLDTNDQNN